LNMKITPILALFLGLTSAGETEDDNFTNSYEDCIKFA